VPRGDAAALAELLAELLASPADRARLAAAARAAAAGPYSWDEIARRTLDLYGRLRA
jgi:glycosyltransferase involved in cell wall biosynthesis